MYDIYIFHKTFGFIGQCSNVGLYSMHTWSVWVWHHAHVLDIFATVPGMFLG